MIGIIGAMDEEIGQMVHHMQLQEQKVIANITFYLGTLHHHDIVLCKCGVGKVNAAMTTQILIDRFDVKNIIFTGVAGALHPQLNIGDIVVSSCCQQHDIDASQLGFPKGEIPMFPFSSIFAADEELVSLAYEAACQRYGKKRVMKGKILSGDQFIADPKMVKGLHQQFNGVCVEMEGAAVAQTAMLNSIPFVIIRSISDKANKEATVNFTEFVQMAANQSFEIVYHMLEHMKSPK